MILAPIIKPINNNHYILDEDFECEIGKFYILIKKDMVTDGASIPRGLWNIAGHPYQGLILGPAVIHDSLYRSQIVEKNVADNIFYEAMKINKVNYIKRKIYFNVVKYFGDISYNTCDTNAQVWKKYVFISYA